MEKQLNSNHVHASPDCDDKPSMVSECRHIREVHSNSATAKPEAAEESIKQLCSICFKPYHKPDEQQLNQKKRDLELELKHLRSSDV